MIALRFETEMSADVHTQVGGSVVRHNTTTLVTPHVSIRKLGAEVPHVRHHPCLRSCCLPSTSRRRRQPQPEGEDGYGKGEGTMAGKGEIL